MPTTLLVFEFIGTTELLVIALVALIVFGPRKLPEIGRTLGKSLAEFKRASEDFKRTWEFEVETERRQQEARVEPERPAAPAALGEGIREAEAGDPEADPLPTPFVPPVPARADGPTPAPLTIPRGSAAYAEAAEGPEAAQPAEVDGPATTAAPAPERSDEPAAGRVG